MTNAVTFKQLQGFKQDNYVKEYATEQLKATDNTAQQAKIMGTYSDSIINATDSFSLMSSEEASNEDSYNQALSLFAQDEIKTKDQNSDDKLDKTEYVNSQLKELNDLNKALKKETVAQEKAQAMAQAAMMFSIIDSSGDSSIEQEELQTFYSEMDKFIDGTLAGSKDGVLDMNQIDSYKNALLDKFYSSEFQKELENAFLAEISKYEQ